MAYGFGVFRVLGLMALGSLGFRVYRVYSRVLGLMALGFLGVLGLRVY